MNQEMLNDYHKAVTEGLENIRNARAERLDNIFKGPLLIEEQLSFIHLELSFLAWAVNRLSFILSSDNDPPPGIDAYKTFKET